MRSRSLQRLVQDHGLKPKDIADLFGITERTWYEWATHPETHMTLGRIVTLAEALNVSEWEIVEIAKGRR